MPSLSGAIRGNSGGSQYASTDIKSEEGDYDALYCGMSEPFEEVDQQNDCKLCEGKGTMPRGADCFACHGSGKKTNQKVWLRYIFENKSREQEVVTFNLYDGGKGGKATTLYLRLRALSGFDDTAKIEAWHDALPLEPRIPCRVSVGWNIKGDRRVIELLRKRNPAEQASAKPANAAQRDTREAPPTGRHTQARSAEQNQDAEPWVKAAAQHAGKPAQRDARNGYQSAPPEVEDWGNVEDADIPF